MSYFLEKQYDLTLSAGALTSTTRAVGIPYRDRNNTPRLKFNIAFNVSSASRDGFTVALDGVVFKNTTNFNQSISGFQFDSGAAAFCQGYTGVNNGNLTVNHATTTTTAYSMSGDVELESWPTWAI